MLTTKVYYICGAFLLLLTLALFLAGGYGKTPELVQLGERHFGGLPGTFFLSVLLLPFFIPLSVACAGLGWTQRWLRLPDIAKRILAYIFAAGILLEGLAAYMGMNSIEPELSEIRKARWITFGGLVCLLLPLVFHLYGVARGKAEEHMKAAKFYALGGLLLILWVSLRTFWMGWPWEAPYVVGMSVAVASLLTWSLGAALGAAALFLSALQSMVALHERVKIAAGIIYFAATGVFLFSLYNNLLREDWWKNAMIWPAGLGLSLLLAVLLLNCVGILRHRTDAGHGVAAGPRP